jgi:hypothetical protein
MILLEPPYMCHFDQILEFFNISVIEECLIYNEKMQFKDHNFSIAT